MIPAIEAQLAAARQKPHQAARSPVKRTSVSPEAAASIGVRETKPEEPGAKPCPVRWNEAGALFREQHKGMFRIVVVGNERDKEATIAALQSITPTR